MTIHRKTVLLFAVAALSATQAKSLSLPQEKPAPGKVGGLTAVLTDATWKNCTKIDSLAYRDESVSPSSLSHDEPLCRIAVKNLLAVPRTLTISADAEHAATTVKKLTIEPMSTATVTLPLAFASEKEELSSHHICIDEPNPPSFVRGQGSNREFIDLANRVNGYYRSRMSMGDPVNPSILLSDGITRDFVIPAFKSDFDTVELRRKADEWPRDFRSYLPFDAVCLDDNVSSSLSEETHSALRAYELLGGAVITANGGARPPKDIEARAKAAQQRRVGDLSVSDYYYVGRSYASSFSSFSDNISKVQIRVGRSLPVGLLSFFLALVAIVVMPATVWYCAKKNRRLFLLAALPGSALALTVVVALVALAAYGTTPTIRLQAVTILDPESRLAVTRGQFAVFSPGRVSGKMSIPSDASFRLRGRGGEDLSVNCGESCLLEGDWARPLSTAFFDFERAERRSERLDVKRGVDGKISVANLLGSPVAGGYVQMDGLRYKLPALAPGEETSVSGIPLAVLSKKHMRSPAEELAGLFFSKSANYGRDWKSAQKTADDDKVPIPDGTYVVRLDGSPFFPSPLAGTKTYETAVSVVAGCVAPEGGTGKEAAK